MSDFDPLPAFNGKLALKDALTFDRDKIHKFLNDVVADADGYRERDPKDKTKPYPDSDPKRRKDDLTLLRNALIALAPPDGARYKEPSPPQSILRKSQGVELDPTEKIPWSGNTESERFFVTFDLLGVFLSIIGPAPTTTTKVPDAKNFFLPLDVVYGKWCITLVTGSGLTPNKAQVTWASRGERDTWFFLGVNARGWGKKVPDTWPVLVQKTRHGYMKRILPDEFKEYGSSPTLNNLEGRQAGWNYGNCAETYPFLYLIAQGFPVNSIHGISLKIPRVKTLEHNWSQYWNTDSLEPPCANCAEVIKKYGAIAGNFTPWE